MHIIALVIVAAVQQTGPFVAHEWGTFTSFHGSDGGALEGLYHEEEPLPRFVHDLGPSLAPCISPGKGLCERLRGVTTKLETPVIYFYSGEPVDVRVRVDFPNGVLSQFYPWAATQTEGLVDLTRGSTSLDWRVQVRPGAAAAFPEVAAGDPWALARQVEAAPLANERGETERYLFYRGLGHLSLPLLVRGSADGSTTVTNTGREPIPTAFLVHMSPSGARYVPLGGLGAGATVRVGLGEPVAPEFAMAELARDLRLALEAAGLFTDEAAAMVRTWSRSWFASEGSRVLYVVPRALTDRLLPLRIEPEPRSLVRVLVGRAEFLTVAAEREAIAALHDVALGDAARGMARLARFHRFLEPVLLRSEATSRRAATQATLRRLLAAERGQ
jgi:hypothetical protein